MKVLTVISTIFCVGLLHSWVTMADQTISLKDQKTITITDEQWNMLKQMSPFIAQNPEQQTLPISSNAFQWIINNTKKDISFKELRNNIELRKKIQSLSDSDLYDLFITVDLLQITPLLEFITYECYFKAVSVSAVKRFVANKPFFSQFKLSPQLNNAIARQIAQGVIWVEWLPLHRRADFAFKTVIHRPNDRPLALSFSPDTRYWAALFLAKKSVIVHAVEGTQSTEFADKQYTCFAFSPNSKHIALGTQDGSIDVVDLATAQVAQSSTTKPLDEIISIAWASNNHILFIKKGIIYLFLYDFALKKTTFWDTHFHIDMFATMKNFLVETGKRYPNQWAKRPTSQGFEEWIIVPNTKSNKIALRYNDSLEIKDVYWNPWAKDPYESEKKLTQLIISPKSKEHNIAIGTVYSNGNILIDDLYADLYIDNCGKFDPQKPAVALAFSPTGDYCVYNQCSSPSESCRRDTLMFVRVPETNLGPFDVFFSDVFKPQKVFSISVNENTCQLAAGWTKFRSYIAIGTDDGKIQLAELFPHEAAQKALAQLTIANVQLLAYLYRNSFLTEKAKLPKSLRPRLDELPSEIKELIMSSLNVK